MRCGVSLCLLLDHSDRSAVAWYSIWTYTSIPHYAQKVMLRGSFLDPHPKLTEIDVGEWENEQGGE